MAVSIVDIAKKAGVSHTTVSRILRNAKGFSFASKTREKVLHVAAEMGYAPNLAAKFMRTKQTKMIGITTESEYSFATYRMIQNCSIAVRQLGYSPVLIDMSQQSNETGFIGRLDFLAGLICLGKSHEQAAINYCEKATLNLPIVTMKQKETSSSHVRSVTNNSQEVLEEALRHLNQLGHTKIAYLGYDTLDSRITGFQVACKKLALRGNIFKVEVSERNNSYLNGSKYAKIIMSSGEFTAAACEDDEFAIGLMSGLCDMGVNVPEDFSVIGFDDLPFAAVTSPKLTSIRVRCLKRANAAVKLLVSVIESNDVQKEVLPEALFFECKLIIRESTGQAPK